MMGSTPIKVLVVDDSMVFREVITRGIASDPDITVVARAIDPFDARDKILQFAPDVMTCDVQMPKMNGIEFIRRLLPQYPLPVIVISTISATVFDAMNAGAVDFLSKPDLNSPTGVEGFIRDLIAKIKIAAKANVQLVQQAVSTGQVEDSKPAGTDKLIAIGASTGGTEAVYSIIKALPTTLPGIVVVQHIPPIFSRMFAERLNAQTALRVKEAETGDYVEPGTALIAPGDQHVQIHKVGGRYKVECFTGERVNGHCPSVDVLFASVAKEAGANAIGVILTGMGYDGAKGLLAMRRKGAKTIGQDEKSCVVYGMPKVAFDIGAVGKQAALANIPQLLYTML
ncbi:MAG: chemotaxis response regulator protein-glutamate methylesterase [Peptococcaceae bacterium]|nr:chemotaxis response regulator protein-glutamate methylesterase [Peptococcaceae bacterium]